MSISYESVGRTGQKARTRQALVDAARRLLAVGVAPTVEQTASEAGIGRATAYRYFPDQNALLAATVPDLDQASLLPEDAPSEPEARLDLVVAAIAHQAVSHEPELRNMLRLSLDPASRRGDLPFRKGRRLVWVGEALSPLRKQLGDERLGRLTVAISSAAGIDSLVWLTDIAGLSREEAVDMMAWSARALLRAAIAEVG